MASMREVKGVPGKVDETGEAQVPLLERVKHYFTELKFEWKKITFPTRKELIQSTIVVFVFTLLIMGVIVAMDFFIGWIFRTFILPT